MKPFHALFVAMITVSLAGCAGSVSAPTVIQPLSTEQKSALHLSDISADAASGVQMSDADFGLIVQKVRGYIQTQSPATFETAANASQPSLMMKLHFTRFDRGNAFARFMLIGLGQIKIDATVELVDASGTSVAKYEVSKDFSFGGVYGGVTTIEDVEDGFAKSVAEVVKAKA